MLAKCANPSCSTPLVYLREGKIFMVESPQPKFDVLSDVAKPKPLNRVEHFWLCGQCSNEMTITYDRQRGVELSVYRVSKPEEIAGAIEAAKNSGALALNVLASPFMYVRVLASAAIRR